MKDLKNLSTKELLDLLPPEIQYRTQIWSLERKGFVQEDTPRTITLMITKNKPSNETRVWKVSYVSWGFEGIESEYPISRKHMDDESELVGGIGDDNLHFALKKMYHWLQEEGIVD